MNRFIPTLIGAASIALLASNPMRAAIVQNEIIDLTDFIVEVPCADGGAGELVVFQGRLHALITATSDQKGGFHVKTHFQPQGLTGEGQSTGDSYQATGVTQDHQNLKAGVTYTYINNFRMIGQGSGNNLLIHETFHVTINANGVITVEHDNFSSECR